MWLKYKYALAWSNELPVCIIYGYCTHPDNICGYCSRCYWITATNSAKVLLTNKHILDNSLWPCDTTDILIKKNLDNGLSSVRHQAIIWTNVGQLFIETCEKIKGYFNQNTNIFYQWNAPENVDCKAVTICSKTQCVNLLWPTGDIYLGQPCNGLLPLFHYLSQYCLISEVRRISPQSTYTASAQATILCNEFDNYTFNITTTSHRGQSV